MLNEQKIWIFLKNQGLTDCGAAGLLGNLFAESGLSPINLQDIYNKKFNITDMAYTEMVDNGTYSAENFINDKAGYGIAQWTYWSRKKGLLEYAKSKNESIGDLTIQLEYLLFELKTYFKNVFNVLCATNDLRQASNIVLLEFEKPANTNETVQLKRYQYATKYFNTYANQAVYQPVFTNSPLVNYTKLSPNKNSPRKSPIDTITIHHVVGQLSVETICEIFNPVSRQGSCNYCIGCDGRIGLIVEEKDRSWCSSNGTNDHRAITIEVADDLYPPYNVRPEVYKSLINLLVDICKRNNIPELRWRNDPNLIGQVDLQNMTIHSWFAPTACPGDFLYENMGKIAEEVNNILNPQNNIEIQQTTTQPTIEQKEEEEEMTQEKFNEMMNNYLIEIAKMPPSDWSAQARSFCEGNGIIGGDINGNKMYKKFCTREELMTIIYRVIQKYGLQK